MKKVITLILLCLSFNTLSAQSKTDIEDIFKMQLFLNRQNVVFRTMDSKVTKNDSLYKIFYNVTRLEIKSLKTVSKKTFFNVDEEFKFYKVIVDEIKTNRALVDDEFQYMGLTSGMINYYILALNQKTGITYRLAGFDTNDFLSFLSEFKKSYLKSNSKKIKNSNFFKNYIVEDLDFKCLYRGLKSNEIDSKDYPCLLKCSDRIKVF